MSASILGVQLIKQILWNLTSKRKASTSFVRDIQRAHDAIRTDQSVSEKETLQQLSNAREICKREKLRIDKELAEFDAEKEKLKEEGKIMTLEYNSASQEASHAKDLSDRLGESIRQISIIVDNPARRS